MTYSVVVPVYNEEGNVPELGRRIVAALEGVGEPFEVLFVDDGSSDGTRPALRALAEADPRVRVVLFRRNFGQEAAVEAGYLNARGDWIIQLDGDLQHPPEEIPKLLGALEDGYDVVYGLRGDRQDPFPRRVASRALHAGMRWLDVELPPEVSTFRVMYAPMARLVASLPERSKFLSGLLVWSGARIGTVTVRHEARHSGRSKYDLTRLVNHAFDLVVGFSSKPLRQLGQLGLLFALAGFGLGGWALVKRLVWGVSVTGWTSLFAAVVVLAGVQLVALSLIGEYVGRIYGQVQQRPSYLIAERLNFDDDPELPG